MAAICAYAVDHGPMGRSPAGHGNSELMVCKSGRKCRNVEPRSSSMTGIEALAHTPRHTEVVVPHPNATPFRWFVSEREPTPRPLGRMSKRSVCRDLQGRCVICGQPGISDAFYCRECCLLEKDVCCSALPWFALFCCALPLRTLLGDATQRPAKLLQTDRHWNARERSATRDRSHQSLVYAINNSLIHWWYPWSSLELTGLGPSPTPEWIDWISVCLRGGEGMHNH